ncbi:MAG: hypothetical protein HOC71_11900 [Candidatus Latescibacteria bacterium]|jgi:DNA-binding CsgD family transcriptional regulator|nr:hypothetical protein [Candidatus Latescibacterota bacterium]
MKNNKSLDIIESLEIKLKHLKNQYDVVKGQYEKTTEEYFKILDEISKANEQLQEEIAKRIKAEKALKKARDKLEIKVKERTIELAKANKELKNDITARKLVEDKLKLIQKELEINAKNLKETNIALKVLLKHQDKEKNTMEKNILSSLKTLIIPYLEKIVISTSDEKLKTYVNIIETNLSEITNPFANQLTGYYLSLTPTEVQIANLVRDNKTTKDISKILNISENAVFFHRRNIRNKLGIRNKKTNLRSYLQSVASS